jgi:hypothetical protein
VLKELERIVVGRRQAAIVVTPVLGLKLTPFVLVMTMIGTMNVFTWVFLSPPDVKGSAPTITPV